MIEHPAFRRVLAIDPGSVQSAWVIFADGRPEDWSIDANERLLALLRDGGFRDVDVVVIEKVESFGMAVGAEVFETVFWSGRFAEAAHPAPVERLPRRAVKVAICHDTRAKDPNIRAALIDLFGGPEATKKGHVLYGITKDVWSALAVAVTYAGAA